MGSCWKITVGLSVWQLLSSSCHRAEIELSELLPDTAPAEDGGAGGAPQDGGAGGTVSEMAGSGGSSEPDDLTPPWVLSISPSDGQRGVRTDSKVVIRFSEPMNPLPSASGSELVGIPASPEWDETGTELSLIPRQQLEYGSEAEAVAYSLRVKRLATDLAGNALAEELVATFYTSRELATPLKSLDALAGYGYASGAPPSTFTDPRVGDAFDDSMKGFASFGLGLLPPETQDVTSATLTVGQHEVTADPYQMGSMMLEHVAFSKLSLGVSAPLKSSLGVLFSDAEMKIASVDVRSVVQAGLAERADDEGQVQFRFGFERAANPNGVTDEVQLRPIRLDVSYLVP